MSSSLDKLPCRSQAYLDLTKDYLRSGSKLNFDLQSGTRVNLRAAIDRVACRSQAYLSSGSKRHLAPSRTQTDLPLQFSTVSSIKIDHLRLSKDGNPSKCQTNAKPRAKRDQLTSTKDSKLSSKSQTDLPPQFSASASSEEKLRKMMLYRQLLRQEMIRGDVGPLKNAAAKLWQQRQQQHKGLMEYLRLQRKQQVSAMSSQQMLLQS